MTLLVAAVFLSVVTAFWCGWLGARLYQWVTTKAAEDRIAKGQPPAGKAAVVTVLIALAAATVSAGAVYAVFRLAPN